MGFVIQPVGGEAEERPRTGLYLVVFDTVVLVVFDDDVATGRLGANTAIVGFRDMP